MCEVVEIPENVVSFLESKLYPLKFEAANLIDYDNGVIQLTFQDENHVSYLRAQYPFDELTLIYDFSKQLYEPNYLEKN